MIINNEKEELERQKKAMKLKKTVVNGKSLENQLSLSGTPFSILLLNLIRKLFGFFWRI